MTDKKLTENKDIYISIHTPTKGVTDLTCFLRSALLNFNPHSHEGSDLFPFNIPVLLIDISIHTPTKGVTYIDKMDILALENFNPHSHEGSDRYGGICRQGFLYFNPHSHEGSDQRSEI